MSARISIRARIVRWLTSLYFRTVDAKKANVHSIRRRWHVLAKILWTAIGVRKEYRETGGLDALWLRPKRAPDRKLLLYLHGGAYIMGSIATHRQMVSHIAKRSGVHTLLPEYRLAPEHPFPAAIEDAVGLYRSLLADGFAANDIAIAGDSAGGGLTVATLLSLRDAGDPLPAAACLLSPWLDLSASGESMSTHAEKDPWFKPRDMPIVARYYCKDEELKNPLVSPVYADWTGLPPIYIQVGEWEILLSDSTRAADRVSAVGGNVKLEIWPGMWHVFQAFLLVMPEARDAIQTLGRKMRETVQGE